MLKRILFFSLCLVFTYNESLAIDVDNLLNMSFQELNDVKVTSVSKKSESAFEAPAAVFVITSDDIRRSGATSIPDALRVVPGIEVAQIDSNKWMVTSRGFSSQFSNKLLVLVDGRSVYTPLFSGVYWDELNLPLEDIDRVEVIRGPGATLWGANAVNGVINIITKSAKSTQGGYLSAQAGNQDHGSETVRYGGKLDNDIYFRTYAEHQALGHTETLNNQNAIDSSDSSRVGFRADTESVDKGKMTLQGDYVKGVDDYAFIFPGVAGQLRNDETYQDANLLSKWEKNVSDKSDVTVQAYLDYEGRDVMVINQRRTTLDFDFQDVYAANKNNEITWGLGYRFFEDSLNFDSINGVTYLSYSPTASDNNLYSGFAQDKVKIIDDKLYVTVGSKVENNYYTGFEYEPNIRLSWYPTQNQTFWSAISRAVRSPTRGEEDINLVIGGTPRTPIAEVGNTSFKSEDMVAYELGYRIKPNWRTSIDATAFYNDYTNLRSFQPLQGLEIPLANYAYGNVEGIELSTRYSVTKDWNLYANYSIQNMNLYVSPLASGALNNEAILTTSIKGDSPKNTLSLISRLNLPHNLEFDNNLYYVENLPSLNIPSYIRFDTRLGWKPNPNTEISVVGQNLFDNYHPEFSPALYASPTKIGQTGYAKVTFRY